MLYQRSTPPHAQGDVVRASFWLDLTHELHILQMASCDVDDVDTESEQPQKVDGNVIIRISAPNMTMGSFNPLTSRPECMPGSRYTGVGVLFFVIQSWNC